MSLQTRVAVSVSAGVPTGHNRRVRPRIFLLVLAPLALAACGSTTPSSTPAQTRTTTAASQTKTVTIRVTSVATEMQTHHRLAKSLSKGDRILFKDVLVNGVAQFGKKVNDRVGTDSGTMTFTSKNTARMQGVANLPDGTIVFNGNVTFLPKTIIVPVTGGTGRYTNASGTLVVATGLMRAPNIYTLSIAAVSGPVA